MKFIDLLDKKIKSINTTKKIVLIDGDDNRSIEAAKKLAQKYKNIEVTLLVEKDHEPVENLHFVNMNNDKSVIEQMVKDYVVLRKGKETEEQAVKALSSRPFFAMMLLAQGKVDGVVGGLNYSTADILRAAFKTIGPKPGIKTISSVMIMHKDIDTLIFSDISVNPKPNQEQLSEIGLNAAEFAKQIGFDPRVAFLSFSTDGSAKTDETVMVRNATDLFNQVYQGVKAIGEIQLDAALVSEIRKAKYSREAYSERANVLVFPDLGAGNIGYKLVQRLGGYGAIGPVVVGTNKPVNDLSRGSTVEDVLNTVLITVLQSEGV
ncbi:phosphate acetyltransferase [Mycoplasmopsis anatis]|uniref:Phosphotransacetylase n=1 Tax=Mycoplasmopsis anatis 1340 TaxID=1034808 RepID=F9QE95_9BACT|nr:phosphate acetyltransferase [Mycoplasmopsis anatis]AWX70429.1 phosphate acetyltransferase [Mycoplasmopsis anatis]EGS28906.1 phosphotransacetylase [Mycoplasmopsis anatis 1340]VEU73915.1 phosphate acetyltransferase [Mycoplasmopsis anatis]